MFSGSSPKKRKIEDNENQQIAHTSWKEDNENSLTEMDYDDIPSCSTNPPMMRRISQNESNDTTQQQQQPPPPQQDQVSKLDRVCEIISREFKREIKAKEMQIEQIDERLEEAKNLLDRLRYAIIAEYYKKQEQQQTMIDAAASMRSESGTMNVRDQIPQIPLHPSIKKIIGKRPQSIAEIMSMCPKQRQAAKNAKHVLHTKSSTERIREQRRLQKQIKEKGIVIDHSKQVDIKTELETNSDIESRKEKERISSRLEGPKPHVLNHTRTSNKQKCHFIVGNTSKYIGKKEDGTQLSSSNTSLCYKWLVYVQTKDADVHIGKYIKKVRFFLHPSYRPNDVVDIHEAPFQVARRGWGEFPMRIQLFFHAHFQQKPLQLVHKVVLDITKSGHHKLGAETVVEVWLRNDATAVEKQQQIKNENLSNPNAEIAMNTTTTTKTTTTTTTTTTTVNLENHKKPRTISFNIKETFDDNFFDFLNKIEGSRTPFCDDIEKIEPTLLVNEPLEPKFSNTLRSPIKKEFSKSPIRATTSQQGLTSPKVQIKSANHSTTLPMAIKDAATKLFSLINQSDNSKCENQKNQNPSLVGKTTTTTTTTTTTATATSKNKSSVDVTSSITNKIVTSNNSKDVLSGKAFKNSSGTIILPVTQQKLPLQQTIANSSPQTHSNLVNKTIFQKKTLQIVNAQGQVKSIQMLVPTSNSFAGSSTGNLASKTDTIPGQIITSKATSVNTSATPLGSAVSVPSDCFTTSASTTTSNISKEISTQHQHQSNSNSPIGTTFTKNVVFQKEGKLYIIDPSQIRLKQQQKGENQVSLLKPQVKQQTQKANSNLRSIAFDHDYLHLPPPTTNAIGKPLNTKASSIRTPELHFGMRETRLSAIKIQDHERLQRTRFERKFNDMHFISMRGAVEFLLRHLPLIATDAMSPARAFPFVRKTAKDFHSLPAFKQRCFEWLRAKFIAGILRKTKSLQSLDSTATETFWSTREIATFARYFGYTPSIKALKQENSKNSTSDSNREDQFTSLIKTEMKSEQLQLEYETLTPASHINHWIENIQNSLNDFEMEENITIDDDNDDDNDNMTTKTPTTSKDVVTKRIFGSPLKNNSTNHLYLPTSDRLETAFELVGEVCRDISVRLRPEQIIPGVLHPSAQTILAHISQLFIERLLRQTIAIQTKREQEKHGSKSHLLFNNLDHVITPLDIRNTIASCGEFDFLTNCHFGIRNETPKSE